MIFMWNIPHLPVDINESCISTNLTSLLRRLSTRGTSGSLDHVLREFLWVFYIYPLVICYVAIENDHRNSGFSH